MAKKTISNSFTVTTLVDGESVFDASLDHNVIGVECDTEGNISETISFLVTISAHYGSENVVGACIITDNHEDVDSDISVEYDTSEPWVAKITFTQGNGLASMLNIAFTVVHPTYGTRVVALAINRVVLGKDGTNTPFYNDEWYAWSNDTSTASVTTEPTISGSWSHSIPSQGSFAYLWKKIIRYNYNTSTKQYVASNAQYFRMSGTNGTSINTKGTIKVAITASGTFPTSGFSNGDLGVKQGDSYMWQFNGSSWSHVSSASSNGDSYTMTKDCTIDLDGDGTSENIKGHLIQWSTEASKWIDLGQFKGESGVTYYTHIAWATNVDTTTTPITVTGFVIAKSPDDTTHIWMGVLVDENSGQDSGNAALYTWSNTKGDGAVTYEIQSSIGSIKIPSNQTTTSKTITFKFYSKTGGADKQAFRTYYTIYRRANNGVYAKVSPESATKASEATVTINNISVAYNAIVVYIWGEDYTSYYDGMRPETQAPKPYLTKLEIPIIKDGQAGERGKVGRFYYYSGFDWDASNNTDTFVVNDAQVPYFSKAGRDGDKYYVFNREETPSGGEMTMAQMAAETTVEGAIQWNEAPWEVMTNDFKYLITQAIFGAYAHLGSWIFNNDYMLSEKDKDGVPRGQRTYNGMDDNQLTTGFIPSIAFDALNGRASFGGDTVRFQPDGSGWLANKSIIWDEDGNASFSGFIKKTPTHITPENESEYIINYFSTLYTFDFQKTGTFVVLQPNVSCDTLHLPCLYQNVAHYYSDEQKMIIRGYVGTKILIYNVSGHGLTIYYMYNSNGGSYSDVLGNGSCATAECKIRTESGIENVYWEFVHCGYIL